MSIGEVIATVCGSGGLSAGATFFITQWSTRGIRQRDDLHHALQVIEHLERYGFTCADYAFADWAKLEEGRVGALVSQPPRFPPFSDDIRWQALVAEHAVEARRFSANAELAASAVEAGFARSAREGFTTALFWTLRLGTEAVAYASFLRDFNGMTPLTFDLPRWDFPTFLRGETEKLDLRRSQIIERLADEALV